MATVPVVKGDTRQLLGVASGDTEAQARERAYVMAEAEELRAMVEMLWAAVWGRGPLPAATSVELLLMRARGEY